MILFHLPTAEAKDEGYPNCSVIARPDSPAFGDIFPHFSKPKVRFLEQMLFGLSASQDCKLRQMACP